MEKSSPGEMKLRNRTIRKQESSHRAQSRKGIFGPWLDIALLLGLIFFSVVFQAVRTVNLAYYPAGSILFCHDGSLSIFK